MNLKRRERNCRQKRKRKKNEVKVQKKREENLGKYKKRKFPILRKTELIERNETKETNKNLEMMKTENRV